MVWKTEPQDLTMQASALPLSYALRSAMYLDGLKPQLCPQSGTLFINLNRRKTTFILINYENHC
jgi:hypothetical protein